MDRKILAAWLAGIFFTVERIRGLLKSISVETLYNWYASSVFCLFVFNFSDLFGCSVQKLINLFLLII